MFDRETVVQLFGTLFEEGLLQTQMLAESRGGLSTDLVRWS